MFDYPDPRLSGLFRVVPTSPDNRGSTVFIMQRSPLLKKLNHCMLLAKYYLYNQKLNQIEPELNEFKNRLNFQYALRNLYKCSSLV